MLAIRSLSCWKTSVKVLLTFERKKPDFDSIFYLKVLKRHEISVVRDLTHVQLLIQKVRVLLYSIFMNISRNVASIRRTSCIRFK